MFFFFCGMLLCQTIKNMKITEKESALMNTEVETWKMEMETRKEQIRSIGCSYSMICMRGGATVAFPIIGRPTWVW